MMSEEQLVERVRGGDRAALGELVSALKDMIFNLSARMLGSPTDAEDATQEILIRLVTNLDSFRGESSFRTWAYRVATNHLLKTRHRDAETRFDSFEAMEAFLAEGIAEDRPPMEDQVLVQEAKLRCTAAMVVRLSRDDRLAFILGEVLELSSEEAAAVLEVSPEAFRKRLSRARARVAEFGQKICGLVDEQAPCRCARQATRAAEHGYLARDKLIWANLKARKLEGAALVNEVDAIGKAVGAMRAHPTYQAPESVILGLKQLLGSAGGKLLQ
jgi:RNA polymerase sigma factor (sigma-70 family)